MIYKKQQKKNVIIQSLKSSSNSSLAGMCFDMKNRSGTTVFRRNEFEFARSGKIFPYKRTSVRVGMYTSLTKRNEIYSSLSSISLVGRFTLISRIYLNSSKSRLSNLRLSAMNEAAGLCMF